MLTVVFLIVFVACGRVFGDVPAYTNHAGIAVAGVPVALTAKTASLSNAAETVAVPLSIFPERERRRLAADYVAGHPEAGKDALLVPRDIRRAVEGMASQIRRAQNRVKIGTCPSDGADEFCERASSALRSYLDREVAAGRLLPAERALLSSSVRFKRHRGNPSR